MNGEVSVGAHVEGHHNGSTLRWSVLLLLLNLENLGLNTEDTLDVC